MDDALRSLERAARDGGDADAWLRLAAALERAGRPDEALRALRDGRRGPGWRDAALTAALRERLEARAWPEVAGRSWSWDDASADHGVHTHERGTLVWWSTPRGPSGRFGEAAGSQSFADLFVDGPLGPGPPAGVLREVEAALGLPGWWAP